MKIQKKHAVQVTIFLGLFLEEGYLPLNDAEAGMISKAMGFARHHTLFDDAAINFFSKKAGLPQIKTTARLDLIFEDMGVILSMIDEVFDEKTGSGLDQSTELAKTYKYLYKLIETEKPNGSNTKTS